MRQRNPEWKGSSAMGIKESLRRSLRAEINKWEKDIAALQARAESRAASAQAQREIHDKIVEARKAIGDARGKLDELRLASEDAAASLKESIERLFADVRKAWKG
jgi:predicted  nucleic acid-binding Zn-ribbon protein